MSKMIVLVGACSAGKSSTAKALQDLLAEPNIHLGIDTFHLAIPPSKLNLSNPDEDYLYPRQSFEDGKLMTEIVHGPIIKQINLARYESVCCFLDHGITVVSDEIFWREDDVKVFIEKLNGKEVILVGMYVSELEGEKRANRRASSSRNYQDNFRPVGMSMASNRVTHRYMQYDITVDTDSLTPKECAQKIYDALHEKRLFNAFETLCGRYIKKPVIDAERKCQHHMETVEI
ncbi:phosphotransferase-like protein [Facilibium subflavum]|uniref:phosphotransferase-like protein n=1 Tax=Facilibium subflavum TaxID=2219058 RepID=UPI000E65257A|nr:hypothetical protein [Facilibium subflavum]